MRRGILIGVCVSLVWSAAVIALGLQINVPFAMMQPALIGAGFVPGLVLAALIWRMAVWRFLHDELIQGEAPIPGSPADIDAKVLRNTVEQALLALLIWPVAGFVLGAGVVFALSVSFLIARIAFWWGYHRGPVARSFGFAATFYPTVFAALATLYTLIF